MVVCEYMAIITQTLFPVTAATPPSSLFSLNRFSRFHHLSSSSSPAGKILTSLRLRFHFGCFSASLHSPFASLSRVLLGQITVLLLFVRLDLLLLAED